MSNASQPQAGQHHHHGGAGDGGTVAVHGMLVVGQDGVYFSHLPMFMFDPENPRELDPRGHPHNFQVIFEANLTDEGGKPDDTYVRDRRAHPDVNIYTFVPEPFDILELRPPRPRKSLPGTVVRGHFEKSETDPAQIWRGLVNVSRVLFFAAFDPKATKSKELEYLLFGTRDEAFCAHIITAPPDFDQVLSVRPEGKGLGADQLRQGVRVVIEQRANSAKTRLKGGDAVTGRVVSGEAGRETTHEIQLDAVREYYFEEGELAFPPNFAQTEEERKAGF